MIVAKVNSEYHNGIDGTMNSTWERSHFFQEEALKVVASIQVVGSTSSISNTWRWAWANETIPPHICNRLAEVRSFGKAHRIAALTIDSMPMDEYLGWEMAAITARLIEAKGIYRCPVENGELYVVYTDLKLAD